MRKRIKEIIFVISAVFFTTVQIGCGKSKPEALKNSSKQEISRNEEKSLNKHSPTTRQEPKKEIQEDKNIIELKPMEEKDIPEAVKVEFEQSKLTLEDYEKDENLLKEREYIRLNITPDDKYVVEYAFYHEWVETAPSDFITAGFIKLYDKKTKKLLWQKKGTLVTNSGYHLLKFSTNRHFIIKLHKSIEDYNLVAFDVNGNRKLLLKKIEYFNISGDGKYIIASELGMGKKGLLYFLDANGKLIWKIPGNFHSPILNFDGKFAITNDGEYIDTAKAKVISIINYKKYGMAIAISSKGDFIILRGIDSIYDGSTRKVLNEKIIIMTPQNRIIAQAKFTQEGHTEVGNYLSKLMQDDLHCILYNSYTSFLLKYDLKEVIKRIRGERHGE